MFYYLIIPWLYQLRTTKLNIGLNCAICEMILIFQLRKKRVSIFFKLLPKDLYPELRNFSLKMTSMFGTCYSCKSVFSLMKQIKKQKPSFSLTDDRLSILMRIATCKIEIDINELVTIKFND